MAKREQIHVVLLKCRHVEKKGLFMPAVDWVCLQQMHNGMPLHGAEMLVALLDKDKSA
jgi:hypothetical protein